MSTGINNPMQISNVPQASQATGAVENGFQAKLTGVWQAISQRFAEAAEDFRFEYARRRALKPVQEAPSLTTMRVAAFLICESSDAIVLVGEGSHFYSLANGEITRTKRPENPYERADLSLSVVGDRLIKEEKEGKPEKCLTNDRTVIGNRAFVVKVIPDEYRREIVMGGHHA